MSSAGKESSIPQYSHTFIETTFKNLNNTCGGPENIYLNINHLSGQSWLNVNILVSAIKLSKRKMQKKSNY
jgi:hypothetical protein